LFFHRSNVFEAQMYTLFSNRQCYIIRRLLFLRNGKPLIFVQIQTY